MCSAPVENEPVRRAGTDRRHFQQAQKHERCSPFVLEHLDLVLEHRLGFVIRLSANGSTNNSSPFPVHSSFVVCRSLLAVRRSLLVVRRLPFALACVRVA